MKPLYQKDDGFDIIPSFIKIHPFFSLNKGVFFKKNGQSAHRKSDKIFKIPSKSYYYHITVVPLSYFSLSFYREYSTVYVVKKRDGFHLNEENISEAIFFKVNLKFLMNSLNP